MTDNIPAETLKALLRSTSPLKARDLTDEQLAAMNHAEWMESFAKVMEVPTTAPMTPRRLGVITRLKWGARYIRVLETLVSTLEEERTKLQKENAELERQLSEAI